MLIKLLLSSCLLLNRRTMPALPKSSAPVQAKALYQRLGRQRPGFWRGFSATVDLEPMIQATMRRSQGSRSFRADFEALRGDRDQALSQLLNA
jgi:hypothetical protein